MNKLPIVKIPLGQQADPQLLKHIDHLNYRFVAVNNNYLTENYNLLEDPAFSAVKDSITKALDDYCDSVCGMSQRLRITQSWIARTQLGGAHGLHNHPNSLFSGVYYISCAEHSPLNFRFENALFRDFKFRVDYTTQTEYNQTAVSVRPTVGDLVIFPSWVEHSVESNPGPQERISLSFNTWLCGNLGEQNFFPTGLKL
jgi:uncharacterized protein (TIGR02466 family)